MKKIGKIFSAVLTVALSAAVALSIVGCGSGSKQSSTSSSSKAQSSATRATSSPSLTSGSTADSAVTRATAPTSTTAPSRPTASTEATIPQDTKIIESAALSHFGLVAGPNTAVDIVSAERAPDNKIYYLATVYYDGYTYPVYVSADGSGTYEPEAYYAMYGLSEQLYQSETESYEYYGGEYYDADPYGYYYNEYGYSEYY